MPGGEFSSGDGVIFWARSRYDRQGIVDEYQRRTVRLRPGGPPVDLLLPALVCRNASEDGFFSRVPETARHRPDVVDVLREWWRTGVGEAFRLSPDFGAPAGP